MVDGPTETSDIRSSCDTKSKKECVKFHKCQCSAVHPHIKVPGSVPVCVSIENPERKRRIEKKITY